MDSGIRLELEMNSKDETIHKIDHLSDYLSEDQCEWIESPLMGKTEIEKKFGGNGYIPESTFVKPVSKI